MQIIRPGSRIRFIRKAMGLKKKEFSNLSGFSPTRLTNVELLRVDSNEFDFELVKQTFPDLNVWVVTGDPSHLPTVATTESALSNNTKDLFECVRDKRFLHKLTESELSAGDDLISFLNSVGSSA